MMKCGALASHRWPCDVPRLWHIREFTVSVCLGRVRAHDRCRISLGCRAGSLPQSLLGSQRGFQQLEACDSVVDPLRQGSEGGNAQVLPWFQRCRQIVVASSLAALLSCCIGFAAPFIESAHATPIPEGAVVLDLANVIPQAQEAQLDADIKALEQSSGWRVRVLTRFVGQGPDLDEIRAAWRPDDRTTVVIVDPSSPNILQFNPGKGVQAKLARPFFVELQSRFGNLFYVREEGRLLGGLRGTGGDRPGEAAAVRNAMEALMQCLAKEGGCYVVPGIPPNQYQLTLICSVFGGFVAGYASRLEPQGIVQRSWIWLVLFFPLWGTLFISFGLGPIVTRTSDPLPVAANVAAFLLAVAAFRLSPLFLPSAIDPSILKKGGGSADEDRP